MKKILLTLTGFIVTLLSLAQSPNLMNYQGVARNAAGNVLPNQPITLRLNILTGSPSGAVVYSETRNVTTNAFGLFNVVVGSPGAISTTGTIAGINWTAFGTGSGSKFLQVEIDPVGGTSFVNVGSTQLVSVPYALNAGSASPVGPAGGDLSGTYPNPTVARLQGRPVAATAPVNRNLLMWDATALSWVPATAAQAGVVSGTGTLNTVAKWTPDGTTIGNSQIFDNGTNVGVGTVTPTNKLTVAAGNNDGIAINTTGTNFANASLLFNNSTTAPAQTNNAVISLKSGGTDRALQFYNSSPALAPGDIIFNYLNNTTAPVMSILNSGDVGIGTPGPVDRLHVVRGGNSGMVLGGGNNTGSEVKFLSFGSAHISVYNRGNNALTFAQTSSLSQTNTLGSELMALTTAGNLGVGTIAPTARVHASAASGVSILGENSGSGDAVVGMNTGTGRGGYFVVNNPASTADGLRGETNGTGASWGVRGISSGTNGAGLFQQTNTSNTANNLQSNQAGLGRAGLFNATNAASTANAVDINVAGTGFALRAASSNAVPKALLTVGGLQLTGIGEAANRVLVTDAAGNATWNTLSTVGGVSGSGTLNYIPKWTPDGATIGNSQLFDNGNNVGLGTVSPNARLDIANSDITRGAFITNSSTSNGSSALLVQNNTLGSGGGLESSGITSFMAPFNGVTYTAPNAIAIKGFSSASASTGFAGGTGVQGSSASGYGVLGLTDAGTAVLAYGVGTGYGLQTIGRVQISGQGAAAGRILTSDAAGNATWQAPAGATTKVSLRAGGLPNTVVPSGSFVDLLWNSVAFEEGGLNYNTSTGVYTIPVTGLYSISAKYVWNTFGSNTGQQNTIINVNGSFAELAADAPNNTGQFIKGEARALLQLNAGDQVKIQVYQSSGSNATVLPFGTSDNNFIIHLVH